MGVVVVAAVEEETVQAARSDIGVGRSQAQSRVPR